MPRVELFDLLRDTRVESTPTAASAKFAKCDRKDARLRFDQTAALSELAETLMRRRSVKSERITENTLIRIAIDMLLADAGSLAGSTEDELRSSVLGAHASHTITTTREGR